jgi:hypothetical protein
MVVVYTQALAIVFSILILLCKPVYGLVFYVVSLIYYPSTLTLKIGSIDFSVSRIVILVLHTNLAVNTGAFKKLRMTWLDRLVIIYFACQVIAGLSTISDVMGFLENLSCVFFDIALPYFAVRLIVTNRQKYIVFLKGIFYATVLFAVFCIFESVTGHNLLDFGRNQAHISPRWGLDRAVATFKHPIYLGVFLAMAGGICAGLIRAAGKRKGFWFAGVGVIFLGLFSTLSSGPYIAGAFCVCVILFYRFRRSYKALLVTVAVMCLVVEVVSNRHFYEVIDRVAFSSSTAWYRTRLIEVAIFEGGMSGHWLMGFGFEEPGWGPLIDGRQYTDMVNHYLLILCRYGLLGLVPFLAIIIVAVTRLFRNYWNLRYESDSWLIWCLGAGLFGALLSFNSVSVFGQPVNFLYIVLALCGNVPMIISENPNRLVLSARLRRARSQRLSTASAFTM